MSLVVGSEGESGLVGALPVPRNLLARKAGTATAILELPVSSARDLLDRAIAIFKNRKSVVGSFAWRAEMSGAEKEIRTGFCCVADVVGLNKVERALIVGRTRELSRVILALEILGAVLDLLSVPAEAGIWLRGENLAEPFDGRSPLQLMAAEGRLGAEITLLYLRARLRLAPLGENTRGNFAV